MINDGLSPNGSTNLSILKACGNLGAIEKGKQIHDQIRSRNFIEKDIELGNALVDMYAKCGMLDKAQKALEDHSNRNVITWYAIIYGYVQHGQSHDAPNSFKQMQNEGLSHDVVTFICTLKACGSMGAIDKGKQIHDEVVKRKLLEKNIVLGNALVHMYASL